MTMTPYRDLVGPGLVIVLTLGFLVAAFGVAVAITTR